MNVTDLASKSVPQSGNSKPEPSGFVLITFLIFVPLLLAGIYVFTSAVGLAQTKTQLESACLKLQNQSFNRQRQRLVQLLKLNPTAKKLSLAKTETQLKITAALASGQIELVPPLEATLEKIIIKQERLSEKQNRLMMQAQEEFQRQQLNILKSLSSLKKSIRLSSSRLWQIQFSSLNYNRPRLAVRTVTTDIAPVYDLEINFEDEQAWRVNWIMKIKSNPSLSSFLNFNHEVQHQCVMSLKAKKDNFLIVVLGRS